MNFDYGNLLTGTWQTVWKHKSIWGLVLVPMSISFLPYVLFFIPLFTIAGLGSDLNQADALPLALMIVFVVVFAATALINLGVVTVSNASVTLGVIRVEQGEGSTKFMDLLRDGFQYFWRILGVMLVINLTIGLVFSLFFLLSFALIMVTIGMASICLQPIMLLSTPLMFLMMGVLEGAQTAVIAEELPVMDAIKRGLQVVKDHVWKYIIVALIVYFGAMIVSSIITFPLMAPMFALPFLVEGTQASDPQIALMIGASFMCFFFPVMILVSSVIRVIMKTAFDLTYLRLSSGQKTENQVIFSET